MQAEYSNTHKNGFIIAPEPTSGISASKPRKKHILISDSISAFREKISVLVANCVSYAKASFRVLFTKLLSTALAASCVFSLFHIFTFGTGVYLENHELGIVHSKQDYYSALSMATNTAKNSGTVFSVEDIKICSVFTLRGNIESAEVLRDNLLLADSDFVSGCELYCDGTRIFTAPDESTAKAAVSGYISSFSMEGNAEIAANLSYKTCVVPKTIVSDREECVRLLSENGNINVVSVVNSTSSEVIPFETQTESDSSLYIGESVTVKEGKEGNMQISRETVYENGAEKSERITSQKIVIEPVTQVVRVGTKRKNVLESGLFYPLKGTLSSPFGSRWGRMHEGIDLAVPEGTPVKAAECGTVSYVSENAGGYGKFIRIDHGYGIETSYAHLSDIQVADGQTVSAGTVIALSGNTGRSTGPHLHFEITENGTPVDPLAHLKN